jgi:hypothetical protein
LGGHRYEGYGGAVPAIRCVCPVKYADIFSEGDGVGDVEEFGDAG